MVPGQVELGKVFTSLWNGRDAFAAAARVEGKVYRALEQRQTLAFEVDGKVYFIKRHKGVTLAEIAKNLIQLRLPVVSAKNEMVALKCLHDLGIRVPVIAAYGKRGWQPSQLESFLVTEDVGPHVTLEDYCRDWICNPPSFRHKLDLLGKVARISRIMHGAGICHRDFYICHFLLMDDGELTLIDLHRALKKNRLATRWIIKDLAGLRFSSMDIGLNKRDLLRFARMYRGLPLRKVLAEEAGFWQAVEKRAQKLYKNP